MASKDRTVLILSCTECKNKNYSFARGRKKEYKVEVKKFCKKCKKSTSHKEGKA